MLEATLADDFGVAVTFRATTTICVERPAGTGAAVEIGEQDPNPFLATVGLRVEPGTGVTFRLAVSPGSMPAAFFTAVEETVHRTLREGLHGWEVVDCAVTMTHAGYWPRQSHAHATFDKAMSSTASDFRNLTPLVLLAALAGRGRGSSSRCTASGSRSRWTRWGHCCRCWRGWARCPAPRSCAGRSACWRATSRRRRCTR